MLSRGAQGQSQARHLPYGPCGIHPCARARAHMRTCANARMRVAGYGVRVRACACASARACVCADPRRLLRARGCASSARMRHRARSSLQRAPSGELNYYIAEVDSRGAPNTSRAVACGARPVRIRNSFLSPSPAASPSPDLASGLPHVTLIEFETGPLLRTRITTCYGYRV